MSNRRRKAIVWAVLLSEGAHIFCCVLPTIFSLLSLLSGAGMIAVMPASMVKMHDVLHHYELPMIIFSAFILVAGWALHWYSQKIDCHDTGCGHGPCDTKKNNTHILLMIASVLFVVNVSVYFVFHRHGGFQENVIHQHSGDHAGHLNHAHEAHDH